MVWQLNQTVNMVPGVQRQALQVFPVRVNAVVTALSPGRDAPRDSLGSPASASAGVVFTSQADVWMFVQLCTRRSV